MAVVLLKQCFVSVHVCVLGGCEVGSDHEGGEGRDVGPVNKSHWSAETDSYCTTLGQATI